MSNNKKDKPKWTWIIPISLSMFFLILGEWGMVIGCLLGWIWGNIGYNMMEEKGQDPSFGWALGFTIGLVGLLILCFFKKKK